MKRMFVLYFSLLMSVTMWAQEGEWELYTSIDGVEIYTQEVECLDNKLPDQVAYLVKVINNSNKDINIEWDIAIWYNGKNITGTPNPENHHLVSVKKGSSVEGDCSVPRGALYIIKEFKAASSTTRLTKFEFQNIQVSKS